MSYQIDSKTSRELESNNNQELNGQVIKELSPKTFRLLKLWGNEWCFCNRSLLHKLYKSIETCEKLSKSFYKDSICLSTTQTNIAHAKKIFWRT